MSITTPPKDYKVLFLDMNSFFASVEQQVQPTLRGQPIGVAPFTGDSGCIIAASREAKAQGIKIGRIGEAKKLCPRLRIVDFWAPWCTPCRMMAPVLDEIADDFEKKIKVIKINTEESDNVQLASDYQIMSIPNMKLFKDGKVVEEFVGMRPKEMMVEEIKKHL